MGFFFPLLVTNLSSAGNLTGCTFWKCLQSTEVDKCWGQFAYLQTWEWHTRHSVRQEMLSWYKNVSKLRSGNGTPRLERWESQLFPGAILERAWSGALEMR